MKGVNEKNEFSCGRSGGVPGEGGPQRLPRGSIDVDYEGAEEEGREKRSKGEELCERDRRSSSNGRSHSGSARIGGSVDGLGRRRCGPDSGKYSSSHHHRDGERRAVDSGAEDASLAGDPLSRGGSSGNVFANGLGSSCKYTNEGVDGVHCSASFGGFDSHRSGNGGVISGALGNGGIGTVGASSADMYTPATTFPPSSSHTPPNPVSKPLSPIFSSSASSSSPASHSKTSSVQHFSSSAAIAAFPSYLSPHSDNDGQIVQQNQHQADKHLFSAGRDALHAALSPRLRGVPVSSASSLAPAAPMDFRAQVLMAAELNRLRRDVAALQFYNSRPVASPQSIHPPIIIHNKTEVAASSVASESSKPPGDDNAWIPPWLRSMLSSRLNQCIILVGVGFACFILREHWRHSWRMAQLQRRMDSNALMRGVQALEEALGTRRPQQQQMWWWF